MNIAKEIKMTKTKRDRPGAKVGTKQLNTAATKIGSAYRYLKETDTTIIDEGLSVYPEAFPDEDTVGFIGLGRDVTYPLVV